MTGAPGDRVRQSQPGIVARIVLAWRGLGPDQRMAAAAALALFFSMFLPWYEKNTFDTKAGHFANDSISAFGALSFVEAAIFLVSAGVLALLFARAEGRQFHLPGGDGAVIFAAGLWGAVLLFYRVFDRPNVEGASGTVGVQWGFFIAFIAAGALALAGSRVRAAHRPEPTLGAPAPDDGDDRPRRPVPVRRRTARSAQPAEVPRPADPPPYVPPLQTPAPPEPREETEETAETAEQAEPPPPPDRLF
jgi:hypothetical protein